MPEMSKTLIFPRENQHFAHFWHGRFRLIPPGSPVLGRGGGALSALITVQSGRFTWSPHDCIELRQMCVRHPATLIIMMISTPIPPSLTCHLYHSRHGISVDLTTAHVRYSQIYCKNKRSDTASCSIRTLIFAVKNDDSAAAAT